MRVHFLFFVALLLGSCSKDSAESAIDFGPDGGISYRTSQNQSNGGDKTDWQADGAWNSREKALFSSLNLSLDNNQSERVWFASVYPNPYISTSGCSFTASIRQGDPAPTGNHIAYVIVDRYYRELHRGDVATSSYGIDIPIAPNTLSAGALYRLYYVSYVPGQQVNYRSHGDIKVE